MNVTKKTWERNSGKNWNWCRLRFGKWEGHSLGELARRDPDYVIWLHGQSLDQYLQAKVDAAVMFIVRKRTAQA